MNKVENNNQVANYHQDGAIKRTGKLTTPEGERSVTCSEDKKNTSTAVKINSFWKRMKNYCMWEFFGKVLNSHGAYVLPKDVYQSKGFDFYGPDARKKNEQVRILSMLNSKDYVKWMGGPIGAKVNLLVRSLLTAGKDSATLSFPAANGSGNIAKLNVSIKGGALRIEGYNGLRERVDACGRRILSKLSASNPRIQKGSSTPLPTPPCRVVIQMPDDEQRLRVITKTRDRTDGQPPARSSQEHSKRELSPLSSVKAEKMRKALEDQRKEDARFSPFRKSFR